MLRPLHGMALGGAFALTLCALLADIAYARSYEIQWSNFAAWLVLGAAVFLGIALLFAGIAWLGDRQRFGPRPLHFLALLIGFLVAVLNSFVHAMDAWQKMPTALILSIIAWVCVVAAAAIPGYFERRAPA